MMVWRKCHCNYRDRGGIIDGNRKIVDRSRGALVMATEEFWVPCWR